MPAALVLVGAWEAWPLFAVPLVFALPLAGPRGLTAAIVISALGMALVADGRQSGAVLFVALVAFALTGVGVGVGADARARALRRASMAGYVDHLTGLHNYAFFNGTLAREARRSLRYGDRLSLLLLDLDHFKAFNDLHGHEAGNRLLAEVGEAIRFSCRASDVAVRYGGEEFAVLVPGPATDALVLAERIRSAIGRVQIPVTGGDWAGTTASVGVAEFEGGQDLTGDSLVERADRALYSSKAAGRDRVTLASSERALRPEVA